MKFKKNNYVVICSGLVLILLICILGLPTLKVFSISNRKKPTECCFSRKALDSGFVISYTHSVNKGRVHDYYLCQSDGTILLDHTIFVSYGAGIPEPEETPGAIFTVAPDGYTISNLNRNLTRLVMAVGIIADHTIVFDYNYDFYSDANEEIKMKSLFAPQTSLILEIKRVSIINYIFHKIK